MTRISPSRGAGLLLVACLALGASGCSRSTEPSTTPSPTTPSPTATAPPPATASATPSATAAAATGDLTAAPWAYLVAQNLPELGSVQMGDLSVRFVDAGRGSASQDVFYSDGTQAMTAGEPLVYLAWTATNTGTEPIVLASGTLQVDVQRNGSVVVSDYPTAGYTALGLKSSAVQVYDESNAYTLAPGESFSSATNFTLGDGGTWGLVLSWGPSDGNGGLNTDLSERAETSIEIS